MADPNSSVPTSAEDRETRIKQLIERLQPLLEQRVRKMAETLTDTPPEQILGKVEYGIRNSHSASEASLGYDFLVLLIT